MTTLRPRRHPPSRPPSSTPAPTCSPGPRSSCLIGPSTSSPIHGLQPHAAVATASMRSAIVWVSNVKPLRRVGAGDGNSSEKQNANDGHSTLPELPSSLERQALANSFIVSTLSPIPSGHAPAETCSPFSHHPLVLAVRVEPPARAARPPISVRHPNFGNSWASLAKYMHIDSCVTSSAAPQSRQTHGYRRSDCKSYPSLPESPTTPATAMDTTSDSPIGEPGCMSRSRPPRETKPSLISASARSGPRPGWPVGEAVGGES